MFWNKQTAITTDKAWQDVVLRAGFDWVFQAKKHNHYKEMYVQNINR